jgi:hypothetical protein
MCGEPLGSRITGLSILDLTRSVSRAMGVLTRRGQRHAIGNEVDSRPAVLPRNGREDQALIRSHAIRRRARRQPRRTLPIIQN